MLEKATRAVWVIILLAGSAASAQQSPPADVAWRYKAPSDIRSFFAVGAPCPGAVFVTTERALIALDASTGRELWALANPPSPVIRKDCRAASGFAYRKDKIVAFDLASGRRLWDAKALGEFREVRGFKALWSEDLLLLFLRTAASDRSVAGVRLSTGEVLWRRDDLFAHPLKFEVRDGESDIKDDQALVADTDTTVILYVSPDGPLRLDRRSGAALWKGGPLAGQPVPTDRDHAAMKLVDSMLVMPRDNGLLALDPRDGRVLWEFASFAARPRWLKEVEAGLLVSGPRDTADLTLLDPTTGTPRWARQFPMPIDAANIANDRYYVVIGGHRRHDQGVTTTPRGRLLALDLTTGDTTGLADLVIHGADNAWALRATDEGILILGWYNLIDVGIRGGLRYQRYYEYAGPTALQILANINNFTGATVPTYAYFVTTAPDSTGRTGASFVRVTLRDGSEAGRIWFPPARELLFDEDRAQLLALEDFRTIAAVRFPLGP
jgi:outer membrane protein assembly factor BamB